MRDYIKYLSYSALTIIIVFIGAYLFYFYLSDISIKAKYSELNGSGYFYEIVFSNEGELNLRDVSIKIHDVGDRDESLCYDFMFGFDSDLSTESARCEFDKNFDNVVSLHCDYLDTYGEIILNWKLLGAPQDCYFYIDYSHDGAPFTPFRILRTETLKFEKK